MLFLLSMALLRKVAVAAVSCFRALTPPLVMQPWLQIPVPTEAKVDRFVFKIVRTAAPRALKFSAMEHSISANSSMDLSPLGQSKEMDWWFWAARNSLLEPMTSARGSP